MKVTIVRPFNRYGGNYRWGSEDKAHVIPALVKRVMDGEVRWSSGAAATSGETFSTRVMLFVDHEDC